MIYIPPPGAELLFNLQNNYTPQNGGNLIMGGAPQNLWNRTIMGRKASSVMGVNTMIIKSVKGVPK